MWRLGTFRSEKAVFPGLVTEDDIVVNLSQEGWTSTRDIVADWDAALPALQALSQRGGHEKLELSSLRVEAPIAPSQILQSGANYRRHVIDIIMAEERARGELNEVEAMNMAEGMMDERAANGEPYLFSGLPSAMCGPYDDVILPREGEQHDWELELAVVIGRPGQNVTLERALEHVACYTIVNDVTTRDLVYRPDLSAIGTDWLRSKNAPTFLPTGPFLVPAVFVKEPGSLDISLKVNGELMQDGSTSDMIFNVAELVAYASRRVLLRSGDLLLTGSPAGNGMHYGRFLKAGDVMEGEITGLGIQRNRCINVSDVSSIP
jgi:2-keto-4-pentenoate hydratase/2-oxohepta-3-ene-1,7-dioic acid hydratase in catechol pathway